MEEKEPFFFFALPQVLISEVFKYLDAVSVGKIDIASTQHQQRDLLLSSLVWCKESIEVFEHCAQSLKYTFNRGMPHVRCIRISRNAGMEQARYVGLFDNVGPAYSAVCNWESISFAHCSIQDCHLASLAECTAGRLLQLNLSVCPLVTDEGVITIAEKSPKLAKLDLSITDKYLITDKSILEGVAVHCHNLLHLNFSHCYNITNSGVKALARGCGSLRHLDLTFCLKISDIALAALAAGKGAKALRELSVSDCTKVTSAGLVALGGGCSGLTRIILNYCRRITDVGIISLSRGCPNMKSLDLNSCVLLTDAGVISIADNCGKIESLKLANCVHLTDAISQPLVVGCLALRKLVLYMCNNITNEGKRDLVRGCGLLRGKDFDLIRNSLHIITRLTSRKRSVSPDSRQADSWGRARMS